MEKNEKYIGIFFDYEDSRFMTEEEIKEYCEYREFDAERFVNNRTFDNFVRFEYNPFTGEKIDWDAILKEIKQK